MAYLTPLLGPFVTAFLLALFLTPGVRTLAHRARVMDRPSPRKLHPRPVPLLGGLALYAAIGGAAALFAPPAPGLTGLVAGATLLLLTGLWDDTRGLRPRAKLLAQGAAALLALAGGVSINFLPHPVLNWGVTVLWLVGLTNAFNLLDNMDGLSAGVAAISAGTFALLAARYAELGPEQLPTAVAGAAIAGACLGFLRHNLYHASIFMGDAGSQTLGFLLAGLAAYGSWRSPTLPTSLLIPFLVLAYPIFDTSLVILLRWRQGRPITVGGRDHSSHRLVRLGLGRTETVLLIYLFALTHALTAALVTSVSLRLALIALAISVSVLFIFGMVLRKANVYGDGETWPGAGRKPAVPKEEVIPVDQTTR
ncbi:MAG: glycosyltransferase family 4 protein [Candidatus Methylomirabilales bacterium]